MIRATEPVDPESLRMPPTPGFCGYHRIWCFPENRTTQRTMPAPRPARLKGRHHRDAGVVAYQGDHMGELNMAGAPGPHGHRVLRDTPSESNRRSGGRKEGDFSANHSLSDST